MGKSAPTPPAAPDPNVVAAAQTGTNVATAVANAEMNRVNTTTPWYNQDWTQPVATNPDGTMKTDATGAPVFQTNADGTPVYKQSISLAPAEQTLLDQSTGQAIAKNNLANDYIGGAFTNMATSPLNTSNVPALQTAVGTGGIRTSLPGAGPIQSNPGYAGPINGQIADAGQVPTSFNTSNVPAIPGMGDFSADRDATTKAFYDQASPLLDIQGKNLNSNLVNEGVQQGSEAWNDAQVPQTMARNNLIAQSVAAGNQEQQQLFGLGLQANGQIFGQDQAQGAFAQAGQGQQFGENAQQTASGLTAQQQAYAQLLGNMQERNAAQQQQFGEGQSQATFGNEAQQQQYGEGVQNASLNNAAAQQALSEDITQRELPLNEYSAFASGSQVQAPGYQATQPVAVQGTNVAQLYQNQFQGQQDAYNANVAGNNSLMSGLFGLGGSALMAGAMFSDPRLKEDAERIGETDEGIPLYSFRYIGSPKTQIGAMADEVAQRRPDAVSMHPSGYLMVDYKKVA